MSLSSDELWNGNQSGTNGIFYGIKRQAMVRYINRLPKEPCLGKGEVVSSNLTGSTSNINTLQAKSRRPNSAPEVQLNSRAELIDLAIRRIGARYPRKMPKRIQAKMDMGNHRGTASVRLSNWGFRPSDEVLQPV